MAKYPIDNNLDLPGIVDGLNYVLSGPSGLGQNFAGYSTSDDAYIRPTVRSPFTLAADTTLDTRWATEYSGTVTQPTPNPTAELTFVFDTPATDPPFQFGDILSIYGTVADGADPDFYNFEAYTVLECTTTEARIALRNDYQSTAVNWPGFTPPGDQGFLYREFTDVAISTDCNGRVSVQGGTDRVFINAQLLMDFDFTGIDGVPNAFELEVSVDRYRGYVNTYGTNDDFFFVYDATVATRTRVYEFDPAVDPTSVTDLETIFVSVIEESVPQGYYWYILSVNFKTEDIDPGYALPGSFLMKLRSLTAQVVKT